MSGYVRVLDMDVEEKPRDDFLKAALVLYENLEKTILTSEFDRRRQEELTCLFIDAGRAYKDFLQPVRLKAGTKIITTEPDPEITDWTTDVRKTRRWGLLAVVLTHHDSHGLCYEVRHLDGLPVVSYYAPSEFIVIDDPTVAERKAKALQEALSAIIDKYATANLLESHRQALVEVMTFHWNSVQHLVLLTVQWYRAGYVVEGFVRAVVELRKSL